MNYHTEYLKTGAATGGVLRKVVSRNFAKFTGKHLCHSLFFNEVSGQPVIETLAQVYSCKFAKFLRKSFLQNTSKRLLLTTSHLNVSSTYYIIYVILFSKPGYRKIFFSKKSLFHLFETVIYNTFL